MEIGKAANRLAMANPSQDDREQAVQNAMKQFQAVYGAKPKEARPIKKTLDKDDFMRIMITEMKHQDPTKPMEAEKMATQMAQLTSVEQLKNVGTAIDKLADKNNASDRLAMGAMIGKTVSVDKGRFNHMKGTMSPVNFELPRDAQKIKINILDERGETIASRDLEPMKAGPNVYSWDGMNESGIQVPSANYIVRIDAEDAKGAKIAINPISRERIVGVSFEGGEPNFLVGDPKSPQAVNFRNVTRIEGDAPAQNGVRMTPPANAMAKPAMLAPKSFAPLNSEQGQRVASANGSQSAPVQPEEPPVKAEGFPSGLSGDE